MDLRTILATAQQQRSIPGLLSMLRGGDPQIGGGGGVPQIGGGGGVPQSVASTMAASDAMSGGGGGGTSGVDVGGRPVQSLLQTAMGSTNQYAPSWVKEQLGAYMRENPDSNIGFGGIGNLTPELNPDNWGPAPAVQGPADASGGGWFPNWSGMAASDPNEKFWTMKDYNRSLNAKYGGDAGDGGDESPNTRNWRLLQGAPSSGPVGPGVEPGNFMYLGHPISQSKLRYDTFRPIDTQEGAGVPGGTLLPYRGFGRGSSAWSTKGQVGFPGQLDPWGTSWGAGGP